MNPKVHHRIPNCPPPVPILNQLDPFRTPTLYFLKMHLNIILPFMPGSLKWSPSFRFPHQKPVSASPLPHTRYMTYPSHSSPFHHPNNIWWGVQTIKLLVMQIRPLPCYPVPLRTKYSLQHPFFKHPQPMFFPQRQRPSYTPIQHRQYYLGLCKYTLWRSHNDEMNESPSLSDARLYSLAILNWKFVMWCEGSILHGVTRQYKNWVSECRWELACTNPREKVRDGNSCIGNVENKA